MKYLVLIIDGASDYPLKELNNKTPLEVANKPNIDKLAKLGICGLTNNVPEDYNPGSDVANMSIFGFNPEKYYTGRGPLEAGSMGIETNNNEVIFRCNTITEEDGKLSDFNAGHISSEESKILMDGLNKYFNEKYSDFKGKFYSGVSYRHVFVYDAGDYASKLYKIETMPPHDIVGKKINEYIDWKGEALKIKEIMLESKEYLKNHEINKKRISNGKKPANMIWLWGQGLKPSLGNFKEIHGLDGAVITGVDLLKGIGVYAGLDIINVPGATGYFDTDYKAKGEYALDSFKNHDIVFVHVEAPDEAGHAQDYKEKIKAIESIDRDVLGTILEGISQYGDYKIAILPDHPTPIDVGTHTRDDVPVLIYSSTSKGDSVEKFDENSVLKGLLKKDKGYNLLNNLINL